MIISHGLIATLAIPILERFRKPLQPPAIWASDMSPNNSLYQLIKSNDPGSIALRSSDQQPITFGELVNLIEKVKDALNQYGLGRGDRIAVVLQNGPIMATAFLSVASAATADPINPALSPEEIEYCLSSIGAKALITDSPQSVASGVGQSLGLSVLLSRHSLSGITGDFCLEGKGLPRGASNPSLRRGAMWRCCCTLLGRLHALKRLRCIIHI